MTSRRIDIPDMRSVVQVGMLSNILPISLYSRRLSSVILPIPFRVPVAVVANLHFLLGIAMSRRGRGLSITTGRAI